MPASCKAVKAKSCLPRNIFNGKDVEKFQRIPNLFKINYE